MHRTLRSTLVIVQAVVFAMDVVAGVFTFKAGHLYGGLFQFLLAAWMVVSIVWSVRSMSRRQHHRRALRELEDRAMKLSNIDPETAQRMAVANLRRVAKLTGAKLREKNFVADIRIGRYRYHINNHYIERQIGLRWWTAQGTCLTFEGHMPQEEMIAATLLLLKNDPSIFHRWRKHDQYYA